MAERAALMPTGRMGTPEEVAAGAVEGNTALVRAVLRAGALTNEAVRLPGQNVEFSGDAVDAAMATVAVTRDALTDDEYATAPVAHQPCEPDLQYS